MNIPDHSPLIERDDLPLPRLEIQWLTLSTPIEEYAGDPAPYTSIARYDLLIPLAPHDIRCVALGYMRVSIGFTRSTGEVESKLTRPIDAHPEWSPLWQLPFRDGKHAAWDSFQLKIPAYFVLGATEAVAIPPEAP